MRMPSRSPTARSLSVSARSSVDGSGLPEGCWWTRIAAAEFERMSALAVSRGCTKAALREPTLTRLTPITRFFPSSITTHYAVRDRAPRLGASGPVSDRPDAPTRTERRERNAPRRTPRSERGRSRCCAQSRRRRSRAPRRAQRPPPSRALPGPGRARRPPVRVLPSGVSQRAPPRREAALNAAAAAAACLRVTPSATRFRVQRYRGDVLVLVRALPLEPHHSDHRGRRQPRLVGINPFLMQDTVYTDGTTFASEKRHARRRGEELSPTSGPSRLPVGISRG